MNCVIKVSNVRATWWKEHMSSLIPEYNFYLNDEDFDNNTIDFVIVWKPEDGWLRTFKNLKCIISMGSGIDHILKDPFLPRDIPIIKTVVFTRFMITISGVRYCTSTRHNISINFFPNGFLDRSLTNHVISN